MQNHQCYACDKPYAKNSVFLPCECIIFYCQPCALSSVECSPTTFKDGIRCPKCSIKTNKDIIPENIFNAAIDQEIQHFCTIDYN